MNGLRKIVTIVASAAICAGASQLPLPDFEGENADIPSDGFMLGDVNTDGIVDSSDASLILTEYSAVSTNSESSLTETQKKATDVNNDGNCDSSDASMVLSYYSYVSTHDYISVEEFVEDYF